LKSVYHFIGFAHSPEMVGSEKAKKLLSNGKAKFMTPSTFPETRDCEKYLADHEKILKEIKDLKIESYDYFFAKANWVCLRYTANGSHRGGWFCLFVCLLFAFGNSFCVFFYLR
jgi:hypothetical protein